MKLELKHLAGYLPYGLKIQNGKEYDIVTGYDNGRIISMFRVNLENFTCIEYVKPILRPLSDLITHSEFVDKYHYSFDKKEGFMVKRRNETYTRIEELEYLFKNHFDIYGLIENNLAISIHDVAQADA